MLKAIVVTVLPCFIVCYSFAQIQRNGPIPSSTKPRKERQLMKEEAAVKRPTVYTGFGLGLDYGGIGLKVEYLPVSFLSLFGGVGFNLASVGVNAGVSLKMLPGKTFRPTATIMYGYNAVLIVKNSNGATVRKGTYFGWTPGVGFEADVNKRRTNKISVQVFRPFRSDEFKRDAQKTNASIPPWALSIGINLGY
ncbi:MAG TPA: hypothetical protein PL009_04240 [Flavipsychrobacter sp.]|nr:hypothetical protein [Flavipsychrobacter sp.]